MNWHTENLTDKVFDETIKTFQPVYPDNELVMAGGAVRDALLGTTPKDLDLYYLGLPDWSNEAKKAFQKRLALNKIYFAEATSNLPWHKYERFLLMGLIIKMAEHMRQMEAQFMAFPEPNQRRLLSTFDWEICLFAYRDGKITTTVEAMRLIDRLRKYDPTDTKYKPPVMRLVNVQFPISNLRRGFKFQARYPLRLEYRSVLRLCKATIREHSQAKKEKKKII
jgi:hypothetical protein